MTSKNHSSVFMDFQVTKTTKRHNILPLVIFFAFPVVIMLCGVMS